MKYPVDLRRPILKRGIRQADILKLMKLLLLICTIAIVTRLAFLGSFPSGFTPDEASFGYDAYSIIKTGRDQWGKVLPLVLESHGDFKMPLYTYLALPSVALFGLTEYAVRFPNAILSLASIAFMYVLSLEISNLLGIKKKQSTTVALVAAFFYTLSPWYVSLSRGAFEANLINFFLPASLFMFFKGMKHAKFLLSSMALFGIALFSYHSARFIVPLVVASLWLMWGKHISVTRNKKGIALALFAALFALNLYTNVLGAGARVADISVFSGGSEAAAWDRLAMIQSGVPSPVARLVHNKFTVGIKRFAVNYQQYYSYQFWVSKGAAESTYGMVPGVGVWGATATILFLCGLWVLMPLYRKRVFLFLIFWLFLAPVPAALSAGVGYAGNRAAPLIPITTIIASYGVLLFKRNTKLFAMIVSLLFLVESVVFLRTYTSDQTRATTGKAMLFGNMRVSELANRYSDKNVIISTSLSEPQMYVAFSTRMDPKLYQNATVSWDYQERGLRFMDQHPEYMVSSYHFKRIDWKVDKLRSETIFIGRPNEFEGATVLETIYYSDGSAAIVVVTP